MDTEWVVNLFTDERGIVADRYPNGDLMVRCQDGFYARWKPTDVRPLGRRP